MAVYKVISNLKRDGAFFEAGEEIELEPKDAEQLIEDGVLEPAKKSGGPMTPEQKKLSAEKPKEETEESEEESEEETEEEEAVEESVEEKPDYSKMTKKDLLVIAKKNGVEIPASAKKNSDIVKLLEKHDKESAADNL